MRHFVASLNVTRYKYEKIIHQTENAYLFLLPKGKKAWVPKTWVVILNRKSFDLFDWCNLKILHDYDKKVLAKQKRFVKKVEKARLDRVIQRDKDKNK